VTHPEPHHIKGLRADTVQKVLWIWTVLLMAALWVFSGRLAEWKKIVEIMLAASLLAMGLWQFRRLTAHGWWKGHWRSTLRSTKPEEWTALLVALNVILIGLVCVVVVVIGGVAGH
jgi:hypothetical protein